MRRKRSACCARAVSGHARRTAANQPKILAASCPSSGSGHEGQARLSTSRATFLAVLALAGCGGASVAETRRDEASEPLLFGQPPIAAADGTPQRIDRLVRGDVSIKSVTPEGFGFYAYLLFAQEDEATRERRNKAALAFHQLTEHVEPLPHGMASEERAVRALLVAPIKSNAARASAAELVTKYDYDRGFDMWRDLRDSGYEVAPVAIVGSSVPFAGDWIKRGEIHIVELCAPLKIERQVHAFRDGLVFGEDEVESSHDLLEALRSLFRSLGEVSPW